MDKTNASFEDKSYTADNIKVLEGLEAVRVRPAMYIGSTGAPGLHHLVYEVVDNSIDEAMGGFCDKIEVTIHFDNSVTVSDNGRGIPVDMHKEEGKSAAEVVMTTLHAGGKFDKDSYKMSGGLHGVGVSVVNALSSKLELEIKRGGSVYVQKYACGKPTTPLKQAGKSAKRGTKITFWPDEEIFETSEFNYGVLARRLKELAFLNQGLTIVLGDERVDKKESFYYKGGIVEYVKYLVGSKPRIHNTPIFLATKKDDIEIEIAFQYVDSYNETLFSFVNNINTVEGGTHLTGFKSGITRTINSVAQANNLLKDFKEVFSGDDVREGLTAVVSIRLKDPQFEGQTKAKLGNSDVKGIVESFVNQKLGDYFEANLGVARAIINKVLLAAKAREASKKAKDLVRKSNLLESTTLPGKLADCQSKSPEDSELFIVEGDSAGGSAKQGRDRRFQAILPLRGKILNVEKASANKMLENEEIKNMIAALGVGIGKDVFDAEKLRYHKIVIMTDADVDGSHIRTLIMTFFFRQMRSLIEKGYLYLAQPPLYLIKKGQSKVYLKNEKELENYLFAKIGDEVVFRKKDFQGELLKGQRLVKFIKLVHKKNLLMINLEKRGMPRPLTKKLVRLIDNENDFQDKAKAKAVAQQLLKDSLCKNVETRFDKEFGAYTLDIEFEMNGVTTRKTVDHDFLTGPEFSDINEIYDKLDEYPAAPYFIEIGKETFVQESRKDLVTFLFDRLLKGLAIQRYKGLGEMNPDQLWETTMDPEHRTLLQVGVNDVRECEEIFDTLMGNDAAKRKDFIVQNALNVRNLDI
ncbi:MAG TPA: DNA topoisomerase (ATP-hydrolyzing) subunit B [Candidatus Aminicenantes bacterium]|nr:DNA topoisomerase (ATP-hydrolyzing) subunit B [Candidatus Aminicenantes bacterium]